jgi:hypothetical protein
MVGAMATAKSMEYLLSLGIPTKQAIEIDALTAILINGIFKSKGVFNANDRKGKTGDNESHLLPAGVRFETGNGGQRT